MTAAIDPDDLKLLRATDLVTSKFRGFATSMGVPVRIARGYPLFWRRDKHGTLENLPDLAPLRSQWHLPGGEQHAVYVEYLDAHAAEVLAKLADVARRHPGERLCLLCYEDLAKDCHRSWLSKWANERFGLVIPELDRNGDNGGTGDSDAPTRGPARRHTAAASRRRGEPVGAPGPAVREVRGRLEALAPRLGLRVVPKRASLQFHDDHGQLVNLYPSYAALEFPMGRLRRVAAAEQVQAVRDAIKHIQPGRKPAAQFPMIGCREALERWDDFVALLRDVKRLRSLPGG